jgi:hypothetical protein
LLEPESRRLLLEALRPPLGYAFERAVGTTYSLDLLSLLVAPLAFASFDREGAESQIIADPVAFVEAVRRHSDRIDIFCQAGGIGVPREHRALLAYVEESVHEVVPPDAARIFHPKVWVIKFASADTQPRYRVLCLSRNLTFDRSWDTILQLEGVHEERSGDGLLTAFVRWLPELCVRKIPEQRVEALRSLADELSTVVFSPPEGLTHAAFRPLGTPTSTWPFPGKADRVMAISPFLTNGCLAKLSKVGKFECLVSRPDSFDLVGAKALQPVQETLVMNPLASKLVGADDLSDGTELPPAAADEVVGEMGDCALSGLHAKLYVVEEGENAKIWTGSANATDAAFGGNVEFLVELAGPKAHFGIDSIIGAGKDEVGMRKLLEPYQPENDRPRELTAAEKLERHLDVVRRAVAGQEFVAEIEAIDDDLYHLGLEVNVRAQPNANDLADLLEGVTVSARPITLKSPRELKLSLKSSAFADFGSVSFPALTSFFAIGLTAEAGDEKAETLFVVNAELRGAPTDRRERTLAALLANSGDLIRLLLLLLGSSGSDDLSEAIDVVSGDRLGSTGTWIFATSDALLEPMIRALASDPARLDEIDRLVRELTATETGRQTLPDGWHKIWDPIWQARQTLRTQ